MSTTPTKTKASKTTAKAKLNLSELQQRQLSGEEIEKTESGSEDADYKLHAHESHLLHVKLISKENDPVKKEYVEKEKVVKLYPVEYARMKENGSFDEYDDTKIMHDPRKSGTTNTASAETTTAKGPMEPAQGLPTLQDAQMKFQELFPEEKDLTAGMEYDQLLARIKEKDADFGTKKDA